ncbi:MAG: hypothetical protein J7J65_02905 [Candidatus Korarchaeota archaeon]|nr:hypothetical protein [Candidatus Korarchaeota archaeon]
MSTASPSNYAQLLGLYRNPFLRSSIIELEDPTAIFSKQWIDDILDSLAAEAMSGVASAFVALTGPPGSGRSLRLHLLNYSYNTADLESIYQEISVVEGPDIIDDLLVTSYGVSRSITKSLKKVLLGMPESLTDEELQQLKTSPAEAGRMIIRSLDSVAPSALLLDDVHNMMYTDERWSFFFFEMIREIVSVMPEGILVVLAMSDEAYEELDKKFPALTSRVHERIAIPPLSDEEAISLVSKRLNRFRAREPESPLAPLTEEVVISANRLAEGNPAKLLDILSKALEVAVILGRNKVDMYVLDKVFDAEREIIDYVKRAPPKMRKELEIVLRNFNGGPVNLEKVAVEAEIPMSLAYSRLEALVVTGLLERDRSGRYYVPREALREKPKPKEEQEEKREVKKREGTRKRISRTVLKLKRLRKGLWGL